MKAEIKFAFRQFFKIPFFLMFCGPILPTMAQNNATDNQLWIDYNQTHVVTNKLFIKAALGARGIISNYDWNQFYLRPAISYRPVFAFEFSGSLGYYKTVNKQSPDVSEYRLHEQLKINWPDLGVIKLFYRVRLEQRFFKYSSGLDDTFNNRLRLLFGIESQDFTWISSQMPIYFQGSIEGFNLLAIETSAETFINQVRINIAIGQRVNTALRYELHYLVQQSTLFSKDGTDGYQNIFRLRLFHSFHSKKG